MNKSLDKIKEACRVLQYLSESDYPFGLVHLKEPIALIEEVLLKLTVKPPDTPIEIINLEQFFRPMVTVYEDATPEQRLTAQRFRELQIVLLEELADVQTYRIGTKRIEAFIIGKLKGDYVSLRTTLIET